MAQGIVKDRFEYVVEVASARITGQDRANVFVRSRGLMIALADGAGGTSNGAFAAQALVGAVEAMSWETDWSGVIEALDRDVTRLGHGQTTAVVLSLDARGIMGCSVGDSGAWLVRDEVIDLTEGQVRKPLVGGGCLPFVFHAGPIGNATLIVASDGLLRYAKQQDITRIARGPDLATAARTLVELVRLPSGALQDDVAVVLCRDFG
ncbi:MAG: hypothetical protein H0T89_26250 [Deltaproteobacteria bacterium]|nr:hypothetical protein [Deltaproteobacteria bacterium]